MSRRFALLTALLLSASAAGQPAAQQRIRNHFDSDAHLGPPAFFDLEVLGTPAAAEWKVVAGHNPYSSPNVLMQVLGGRPADSIAIAVRRNAVFRDGTWSVAIEKGSGRAGLVFRMVNPKNYCLLLVDLSTGEARLTASKGGKAVELGSGRANATNPWGILSITARGSKIRATWDGKALLEATAADAAAGAAGVATAGPEIVAFDDFVLDPETEAVKR